MPTCRPLASRRGLLEVRSSVTQNRIARVLFCIHQGQMVLLHGFIKKTQQTPESDLDLAVKRQKEVGQSGEISMWALRSMSFCGRRGFTRK